MEGIGSLRGAKPLRVGFESLRGEAFLGGWKEKIGEFEGR